MAIEIIPLHLGTIKLDKSVAISLSEGGQTISVVCLAWLIKGGQKITLVDTGPPDQQWSSKYHKPTTKGPEQLLAHALGAHGVEPEEVEVVINTHLHWDHCSGNHELPRAKIYLQRKELEYAAAPWPRDARIYESDLGEPLFTKFYDRIQILDGDAEIIPGIRVIHTPGHTPGHQSVVVNTARGLEIIAGDLFVLYESLDYSPPWPPGVFTDLGAFYASAAKILNLKGDILPSHDPKVLSRVIARK